MSERFVKGGEIWEAHLPYVVVRSSGRNERYINHKGRNVGKTHREEYASNWYDVLLVKAIIIGLPTWNGFDPVGIMFPRYGCEKYELPIIKNGLPTTVHSVTPSGEVFQQRIGKEKVKRSWYSDTGTFAKFDILNPSKEAYTGSGYERWMPHTHLPVELSPISTELWDRYAVLYQLMVSDPERESKGIQYAK